MFEPQHFLFSEEESIDVSAGVNSSKLLKQKVKVSAVKPDHEYEEKNFMEIFFQNRYES